MVETFDKMARGLNGKSTNWPLEKIAVDKMACSCEKQVGKLANWQNGELMKWQVEKMGSL